MLEVGDQIVYIPNHAKNITDHPDHEYGFVTAVNLKNEVAFCRYWSKSNPNKLRTLANSEATPVSNLQLFESVNQEIVDNLISEIWKELGKLEKD